MSYYGLSPEYLEAIKDPSNQLFEESIDKLSGYLDEKRTRDPKGNILMMPSSYHHIKGPYHLYDIIQYAKTKGIIIKFDMYSKYGDTAL